MSAYGGPGQGGSASDFEGLFRRGGPESAPPFWAGKLLVVVAGIIGLIVLLGIGDGIYTDWLWFNSLSFAAVFVTRITVQIWTFLGFGLFFALLLAGNLWLAQRSHTQSATAAFDLLPDVPEGLVRFGWGLIVALQAIVMASIAGGFWASLLRFANATPFGVTDPILNQDAGFYVFRLPVYRELQVWLLWTFLLLLVNVALAYGLGSDFSLLRVNRIAAVHLSILGAALLGLVAWNYQLDIYGLLFSQRGVTSGASYTDVHVQYGAYRVLTVITGLAALGLVANAFIRKLWLPVLLATTWLLATILGAGIIPALVQQFRVKPNEFSLEQPYIANNIAATRQAFNLDHVAVQSFNIQDQVTQQQAAADQATIQNIRLLDYRPLQTTYNQIQSIRQYYDFPDIEIDRYTLNGQYQEVMLGGRELDTSRLAAQAQTWVNLHLQYTHGYGLVMSPVATVTAEGLPNLLEQNLPPEGILKIDRPEIYYGMQTNNWVIVDTQQREFDYPKGDQNVFATYAGATGVRLDTLFKRLAYAWHFADLNVVITNSLTPGSQILYNRDIQKRVQTIAPFLTYDRDPYLVVDNGHMSWIQDAYTTSDSYPYSQPQGSLNYIRNSVKVVVDAYDGTTTFYVADPADPIIRTYQKIFPTLFKPLSTMPAGLRAHIRYPEDMFLTQVEMYQTYHMTDPQVFYNKEDLWAIPQDTYAQGSSSAATAVRPVMEPYYVLMRLPGETQTEFLLMLPFTPANKSNMISWLVARSDGADYGKLLEYSLPKDQLVYGPQQINSRIDQDPTISSQLTLWNQQGSQVLRGNLLAIPVGQSFLFVEPLFLLSQSNPLPELKRVIVANGNQIAMSETLDGALSKVFAGPSPAPAGPVPVQPSPTPAPSASASPGPSGAANPPPAPVSGMSPQAAALARDADDHYNRAQAALRAGDIGTYGQEMKMVEQDIQQLIQLANGPA